MTTKVNPEVHRAGRHPRARPGAGRRHVSREARATAPLRGATRARLAHGELAARGVRFRSEPHQIADLGDRVVWLSDGEDGEDNVFALMAEVPKQAGI